MASETPIYMMHPAWGPMPAGMAMRHGPGAAPFWGAPPPGWGGTAAP